jgi:hypothetical protein
LVRGETFALSLASLPAWPAAAEGESLRELGFNVRPASPAVRWDGFDERYLQVPLTITPRLRDLAARLSAGEGAPARTARNIIRYLNGRYTYSLDTRIPPYGEEFTDDFLFVTRRGYCVHFATAFVMLARLNRIPCRYATGFLAVRRPGQRDAVVTGYNAHAWPEIWIDNLGWVTVEATPALSPANYAIPDFYRFFNPGRDGLTARQLEAFLGGRIAVDRREATGSASFFSFLLLLLPWAGGVACAAAAGVIGVKVMKKRLGVRRSYRGGLRRFNRALCRLVTRMERRHVPSPEKGGWLRWGEDAKKAFPGEEAPIDALVGAAVGVFFARRPAEAGQAAFVRRLEKRLRAAGRARNRTSAL